MLAVLDPDRSSPVAKVRPKAGEPLADAGSGGVFCLVPAAESLHKPADAGFAMTTRQLQALAREHGTPLVLIDHDVLRRNYAVFKKHLPKVQAYFAVKANPEPAIIRTLYRAGGSFDVASLPEFMLVYENIKHLPPKEQQDFIWDKIIFANPTKPKETLQALDQYKPLVTFDNLAELKKIKQFAPHAGVVLRLRVPNTGSLVELSSKFGCDPGDAVDLIRAAFEMGLVVEGLSFHVGSQCTNFDNYAVALNITADIFHEARKKGYNLKIVDIGGGFPVPYDAQVPKFEKLAKIINAECQRLFPADVELIAEPGRFIVATAAMLITEIIGKARRDGKIFYHINDGVYHTFSGVVYDHWIPNLFVQTGGKRGLCGGRAHLRQL